MVKNFLGQKPGISAIRLSPENISFFLFLTRFCERIYTMLRIDNSKPIELMIGDNERVIKLKVGSLHSMLSNLSVVRKLWNKRVHHAPKELRRGWIKCVLETHRQNRDLYLTVLRGTGY